MTEKSESYEVDVPDEVVLENLGRGSVAEFIMEQMSVTDMENGHFMFEATCTGFTVESLSQAGQYQNVRGRQEYECAFHLYVPVRNPHHLIDDSGGNLDVLAQAFRKIARTLDLQVFKVAGDRLDTQAVLADEKAATKGGVKIGQSPKQSEVL